MVASPRDVLAAVARRLEEEPEQVLGTLRLIADPEAVPEPDDTVTVELARAVNARRLAERWSQFRARSYTTGQVRQLLGGITRQAVALRVANGRLLAADLGGRLRFPDWQFGANGVLPGLPEVLGALAEGRRGPLAADALMRTALPEEGGRSPAELLAAGDAERVAHYARAAGGGF